MLPMINVNPQANDGDIKKQISTLRTQMATLRDAIEADLSNIRYDNLSPDLQKRIDEMDKTLASTSETTNMVAQSLAVNYATIKDLAAQTARINTIEANYITASEVSANYASFGWVQALDAIVGTINADYVKTGQLEAVDAKFKNLSADNITSGTLQVARLADANGQAGKASWHYHDVVDTCYVSNGKLYVAKTRIHGLQIDSESLPLRSYDLT